MAKSSNQKLKLLYLAQIFARETDDSHKLTMNQIISRLNDYGINGDRKTLYADIEELQMFGMDIIRERNGRNHYYYLGCREFELPELKLLVDSVQSAKFITDKKSKALIRKLEALASRHEAKLLDRQVITVGRVKTMNESIYYNVHKLHEAIGEKKQIRFKYFQWDMNKKTKLRKNGNYYQTSPLALVCRDDNYYLVAYDGNEAKTKHFRVDKMLNIEVLDEAREGEKKDNNLDVTGYVNHLFGMYGGEEKAVTLEADKDMIGVLIDRFGKDIPVMPVDGNRFATRVNVAVSRQFYGWLFGLGDKIKITKPADVVEGMKKEIEMISKNYK